MSESFRSILQKVTEEKLEELKVQKDLMTNHFHNVLKESSSNNEKKTLQILYEAVKDCPVKDTIDNILVENLKTFLQNSEHDLCIGPGLVSAWNTKMKEEIKFSLRKCEYSYLYGELLSEWLESEERKKSNEKQSKSGLEQSKLDKEKSINNFRRLMFSPPSQDEFEHSTFRKFLSEELFNFADNVENEKLMESIRKETGHHFDILHWEISTYDIQCCIKGLITQDLLSEEKKGAMKELDGNNEALTEVASLLTSRLRNLARWKWPSPNFESVEIRRGLAGKYTAFINEDVITAIFLQYVGVQWASYFKQKFLTMYHSQMWKRPHFITESIEFQRNRFHQEAFLSTLPDSMQMQDNRHQDEYAQVVEERICNDAVQCNSVLGFSFGAGAMPQPQMTKRMAKCIPPRPPPPPKSDVDFKQSILHILSTEMRLNQVLRPNNPLTVVQANLESFGPSLIHDAALIALEYFGVPKHWLGFFRLFLTPKIRLDDNDVADSGKEVLRGVPASHALSSLFEETLLFVLELHVNRKCGIRIYRISDEFWFWGHQSENVEKAWADINSYGKMTGLKINENRCGSVAMYSQEQMSCSPPEENLGIISGTGSLPQKTIHWGYLQLHSNGTWRIDPKAINKALEEMRTLLAHSECVLEWINIFNKYISFFTRNMGKCCLVSGKQHLDQIIGALKIIYNGLFANGSPLEALMNRYPKLKENDVFMDALAFWPLERGGLGLVNPFINITAIRETIVDIGDEHDFKKCPDEDQLLWEQLKADYERRQGMGGQVGFGQPSQFLPKLPSWEEYISTRETQLSHWHSRYLQLLTIPGPKVPSVSDRFWNLNDPMLPQDEQSRTYIMWLFTYYETQFLGHFGNVKFINSKLLPMSMIANIQKSAVKF